MGDDRNLDRRATQTKTMTQFRLETRADGLQRVISDGLAPLNQQRECALELNGGVSPEHAERVLRYISDYVTSAHQVLMPGETMRYGWSTLRFAQDPGDPALTIEELAQPLSTENDVFVRGAAKAIAILRAQDDTVRRNGGGSSAHHPHRSERAVICRRLSPTSAHVMVFDRIKARQNDQSGWFVGCGSTTHDHNDVNELASLHLVHLSERDPRIVPYLAMPEDSRIVFEPEQVFVFGPNEQEGHPDTPPLLT
jgi:hypothetical protein